MYGACISIVHYTVLESVCTVGDLTHKSGNEFAFCKWCSLLFCLVSFSVADPQKDIWLIVDADEWTDGSSQAVLRTIRVFWGRRHNIASLISSSILIIWCPTVWQLICLVTHWPEIHKSGWPVNSRVSKKPKVDVMDPRDMLRRQESS